VEMGFSLARNRSFMNADRKYDVAIVGGGLAGLSLSILLTRKGYRVCLFEKEIYPFHKVCGEYISMESWDFLVGLGLPLNDWGLPKIQQLIVTAPNGESIRESLPLGGFGISRYKLDAALAAIAKKENVDLFENIKVNNIHFDNELHQIETSKGLFFSSVACACYGKKANLDVKWKRSFLKHHGENYVGVKYHVRVQLPDTQIALHNFPGGYCGISKIEDGRFCLCYLTNSNNLKKSGQSISIMEEKILKTNPVLRKLLDEANFLFEDPVTIAQISFAKKSQTENHVLCVGDAAGMITPLCGNGMSMALHASKIAAESISSFMLNQITRDEMEKRYQKNWNHQFSSRLRTGRIIQRFFGNPFWSAWLIRIVKPFPFLVRALIRQTHGEKI
jgi:flavin-dependent dehydrogenase